MAEWECSICGYVYDPEIGEAEEDIEPGTPFEDLPFDFLCPMCGYGKDMFEVWVSPNGYEGASGWPEEMA